MTQKKTILPIAMALAGGMLMGLRFWLYRTALDEKNLLVHGHPISFVIWLVAAVCLGLAVVTALGQEKTEAVLKRSLPAAAGDVLFALVIAVCVFSLGELVTLVDKLRLVAGVLCAPLLIYSAVCRIRRKPVFFGCYAVVCVFFALYLVASYQLWSSNPQLQDYVFAMLACVAVTLYAYQNAACCVDGGNGKLMWATGLMAVCFGIAAIANSDHGLLYGGAALWALTGLLPEKEHG